MTLRLLNALNSEDRGLKVRFSLAMIVFETFELILRQMLSSQGKNAPSNPYPHYLVRLAASREVPNTKCTKTPTWKCSKVVSTPDPKNVRKESAGALLPWGSKA